MRLLERKNQRYQISGENLVEVLEQNLDLTRTQVAMLVKDILGVNRTKAYNIAGKKYRGKGKIYEKLRNAVGHSKDRKKINVEKDWNLEVEI